MTDVARSEGIEPSMGQSPFAIARGQGFERSLFADDARRLRRALLDAELLDTESADLVDLRLRRHGGSQGTLDESLAATRDVLSALAESAEGNRLPALVAGATIHVPGGPMLPEAILVLDVLLVRNRGSARQLIAGEVKTYPDRGGYNDAAELATARAQLGVYLHGLEIILKEWGLLGRLHLSLSGFLVLTRPGFNLPVIRAGEDLRYQLERARRGFERLREVAAAGGAVGRGLGPGADEPVA